MNELFEGQINELIKCKIPLYHTHIVPYKITNIVQRPRQDREATIVKVRVNVTGHDTSLIVNVTGHGTSVTAIVRSDDTSITM